MENKTLIEKAIKFIQSNPTEDLTLQTIAENAGFSLNYFDTMFRNHTGYTPVEYSRIYKLTRSALDLRRTKNTILNIALNYGYSSPESYTRAFKSFYGITPSEYRERYSDKSVTWNDLSSRIAISHFAKNHPELKPIDSDSALDFCFTNNPLFYAEDIVNLFVGDVAALTLGNTESPEHFIYVSDYNDAQAVVNLVCPNEVDALVYLKLLSKHEHFRFTIRKPLIEEWESFDSEIEKLGLSCRYGYDMIYLNKTVNVPNLPQNVIIRQLTIDDMPILTDFKNKGGCADCHINGLKLALEGKANLGERGFGLFLNNELVCLALPVLDEIRTLKKYDIGAVLTLPQGNKNGVIELLWKYVIEFCLSENSLIGNANAKEIEAPLGVKMSQDVGLTKITKVCIYTK